MKKISTSLVIVLPLGLLIASCLSDEKEPISPEASAGGAPASGGASASGGSSGAGVAGSESPGGHGGALHNAGQSGNAGQSSAGQYGEAGQASAGKTGEAGKAGQAGNQGEAGSSTASTCPVDLPGPAMAEVSSPLGVRYCIDRHEVTQGQYQTFVEAKGDDVSELPPICEGIKTLKILHQEPEIPYGCPTGVVDPETKGDYPAECVTWCGAYAYCKWAGKRLCGKIGGGGMILSEKDDNYKDPNQSQWYNACSQGGKYKYSYGDVFLKECSMKLEEVNVLQSEECKMKESNLVNIVKMNGSVQEWEDACEMEMKGCRYRGGSYTDTYDTENRLRCDHPGATFATSTYAGVGFRCCLDLD